MSTCPNEADITYAGSSAWCVSWSRLAGIAAFSGMLLWTLWSYSGGLLNVFLDVPSCVLMIGLSVGLLLTVFGWKGLCNAFGALVFSHTKAHNCADAVNFFRLAAVFALACGFLGTLIGLVAMLQNMSDPSQIGKSMALALLTQMYGVILAVLSYVAAVIIARPEPTTRTTDTLTRSALPVAGAMTAMGTLGCLMVFAIMLLSLAQFDG